MSPPRLPPGPAECPSWPSAWALFLDIDGTLLDLAPTPSSVQVPATLPSRLQALAQRLGGALALVSGRPLGDIDRLIPGAFDAAGTHGAEWRLAGEVLGGEPEGLDALAALKGVLERQLQGLPGTRLEIKPRALALHYRQAPELEDRVLALAREALGALGPSFRLQAGKLVAEILPASAGKGDAIRRFMERPPYAGRAPVFAGDDLTDEDGFAAVNALGGISIRIGHDPTSQARYRLAAPADLHRWLQTLVAAPAP